MSDCSQKELVAAVVKYHLRATDEQVASLMTVWGLESVDDLPLLSEKEILDQQIPIIHFRRAVDNQWEIPPYLTFGKPEVPMESITIAPVVEVGEGVMMRTEDLEFRCSYEDITVPHPTNPGERVIARGRADYDGRSISYKCICDYQLAQAIIGALRILGITSLPSSPAICDDTFHLKKFLEVGDIRLSQNTSYMYKAQVTGKDVFFNILQRGGYTNPNDSSETSEERDVQLYSVFKEYLTEMLPGGKFLKEYGGMSSPPDQTEQQHIIRYTKEEEEEDEFSNIIVSFEERDENEFVDYKFRNAVDARYITLKPGGGCKTIRCDVFVDHSLQDTPQNQRAISSFLYSNSKDSTLQSNIYPYTPGTYPDVGWLAKNYNDPKNEWLRLDLQSIKKITGIRMMKDRRRPDHCGACVGPYDLNFALEFCDSL